MALQAFLLPVIVLAGFSIYLVARSILSPPNFTDVRSIKRDNKTLIDKDDVLPFIPIGNHGFYAMHVGTEVAQLDLLTLARFDRQRIGVYPLVCGHVRRVVRIGQNIEDGRIVDDRQKRHGRDDLFENVTNLCLNL